MPVSVKFRLDSRPVFDCRLFGMEDIDFLKNVR